MTYPALGLILSRQKRNCNVQSYWNHRDGTGKRWTWNTITRRRGREMAGRQQQTSTMPPCRAAVRIKYKLMYKCPISGNVLTKIPLNASCNIKPHTLWINRWLWVITENSKYTKGDKHSGSLQLSIHQMYLNRPQLLLNPRSWQLVSRLDFKEQFLMIPGLLYIGMSW